MTTRLSLAFVASMLLVTAIGVAAEPQAGSAAQGVNVPLPGELGNVLPMRREAAMREYEARITEFKSGKVPANVVLQSNLRLLHISLATASPNAAVEYDRRAAEIEATARKHLAVESGSRQDVEQAKSARLDVILKDLLVGPASDNR